LYLTPPVLKVKGIPFAMAEVRWVSLTLGMLAVGMSARYRNVKLAGGFGV
jgi:hypothetical protein